MQGTTVIHLRKDHNTTPMQHISGLARYIGRISVFKAKDPEFKPVAWIFFNIPTVPIL